MYHIKQNKSVEASCIYIYIYNDQKFLQKDCFPSEDQNSKNEAHSFSKNSIMDATLGNTLLRVLPYGAIVSMDQPHL
jgi:hypothetical protein